YNGENADFRWPKARGVGKIYNCKDIANSTSSTEKMPMEPVYYSSIVPQILYLEEQVEFHSARLNDSLNNTKLLSFSAVRRPPLGTVLLSFFTITSGIIIATSKQIPAEQILEFFIHSRIQMLYYHIEDVTFGHDCEIFLRELQNPDISPIEKILDFEKKQLFCDVTLTAQGQQFHCHKAVLASCSQYFRSLFSSHPPLGGGVGGGQDGLGPPKDQQPPQQQQPPPPQEEPGTPSSSPDDKLLTSPRAINNLVLQGCSAIGLRLVLEYLYTANVTLSLDTVEEVLSVSKILHIPQVTKLCVQFLNDQISVQNYKQYAPDLMKRLRFALIPAPELVERVQSVDFMRTDPRLGFA
ncbi:hypothetical protein E2I00_016695, partial [Balaenoptera physalus]